MVLRARFLVSLSLVLIFTSTSAAQGVGPPDPSTDQLVAAARPVLRGEYDTLTSGLAPIGGHVTTTEFGIQQSSQERADALAYRRSFNAKHGVSFTSVQFELKDATVARLGGRIRLGVMESYSQTFVAVGKPREPDKDVTIGIRPHTFEFEYQADRGWVLTAHIEAPLPSNPIEPNAIDPSLPSGGRTTQIRGDGARSGKVMNARPLAAGTYDRAAAKQYITQWATTYNPSYRNFEQDGSQGGDCTNFASQALRAGGWQYKCIGCWYTDWTAWWYDPWVTQTRTWTYAPALKYFLETQGRAHVYSYFEDLRIGDPMSIDFGANGSIDHTMVVDERYAPGIGYIYMSYHTYPTYHRVLSDILASYPPDTNAFFAFSIDGTY